MAPRTVRPDRLASEDRPDGPDCGSSRHTASCPADPSRLASLSEELVHTKSALANICRYAESRTELLKLSSVSRVFHEVASSEHVWDLLHEKDFPYYHKHLLARRGVAGSRGGAYPYVPWYSEYRKHYHQERCWETGNLTRKAPVVLSGHLGCVFGACFLSGPFTPGTICTGAHIIRGSEAGASPNTVGEIKMWLPSRGTGIDQVVREFGVDDGPNGETVASEGVPEGMDVETFTKEEIARAVGACSDCRACRACRDCRACRACVCGVLLVCLVSCVFLWCLVVAAGHLVWLTRWLTTVVHTPCLPWSDVVFFRAC